ncbi:MAG TPA: Xaa-Pro peptidase family protein [Cyclobacteriaceae bacterium]|nr:aminopeptidase P family protein [Cyclobacteriaceae bacterium]MCB9236404.1 aminopeptidase P family protein [Flammeovirgaceae bacterium]MCB0499326.1 aminopeptidase P family protein [Cyclobacteriaceae bacterium]MCO5272277.1 Xaa-Pro peptidase family protein [Cyclobacteriaceae bacterium]MCW5902135.1 aminopeptidase P family protein [Cyclobacteriaceae bacterium]
MAIKRRDFIKLAAGSTAGAAFIASCQSEGGTTPKTGSPLDNLKSMTDDVQPISLQERESRIEKAQRLMAENKIEALYLDGGTSMAYFTGIRWGTSERMMAAIIPAKGEVKYISPAFEAARVQELMTIGNDIRVWEEHESPYKQVALAFKDMGIRSGNVAMEERVRFFLFDGIRKEASHLNYVSGDPVTIPCRMFKTPAEIALMQRANDVTIEAYKASVAMLEEGMTPQDFSAISAEAHKRLGASGGIGCNFGEASAYPHGSIQQQYLKKGDIVLMDGGCGVGGYRSDISRTVVFGAEPTPRQREVWDLQKKSQAAGFAAAKLGDPCENVDIAARKVLTDAGYGPGYKVPGCPHRTGHGIGMDVHEWGNMVLDNKQPLMPGMCFSIEPTISIYGEFGVRLEDCAYMTEEGVKWFTVPSPSIDKPFHDVA